MDAIREILFRSLLAVLCAGGLVGIVVGFGMLFKPDRIVFLNQYFSRWVGTQKLNEQLDRPRWIERYFYRHHRAVGSFLLIGAIFILYVFMFSYNVQKFSAALPSSTKGLWIALTAMLLVGGVVAALVGIIVLARPSLLRDIEKASNRWISTDRMAKSSDAMHHSFDQSVLRHRKLAGAFLIVGGLYVLIVMSQFFWRSGW